MLLALLHACFVCAYVPGLVVRLRQPCVVDNALVPCDSFPVRPTQLDFLSLVVWPWLEPMRAGGDLSIKFAGICCLSHRASTEIIHLSHRGKYIS
jgi:hypothetical protein